MELQELLQIYQAATLAAVSKERSVWTISGIFLITNAVLVFGALSLFIATNSWEREVLGSVLGGLGILISLSWAFARRRESVEQRHWEGLLRSVEGEFAGAEFQRSLHRQAREGRACIAGASWRCSEWAAMEARISRPARGLATFLVGFLPWAFALAWVATIVGVWS